VAKLPQFEDPDDYRPLLLQELILNQDFLALTSLFDPMLINVDPFVPEYNFHLVKHVVCRIR
jgi:hypothetical protein